MGVKVQFNLSQFIWADLVYVYYFFKETKKNISENIETLYKK